LFAARGDYGGGSSNEIKLKLNKTLEIFMLCRASPLLEGRPNLLAWKVNIKCMSWF
jgi:hypothetical protein